jgi:hypothetical protein
LGQVGRQARRPGDIDEESWLGGSRREEVTMSSGQLLGIVIAVALLGVVWQADKWANVGRVYQNLRCTGCEQRERTIRVLQVALGVSCVGLVAALSWGASR